METGKIRASLNPFDTGSEADVDITLYVVTGKHGFLRIPESFCKECKLFFQAIKKASGETEVTTEIKVKS